MHEIKKLWKKYAPVWLLVAIDLWWLILLILIFCISSILFCFQLTYTFSHPEQIGEYFGKIIKGYENVQINN